MKIPGSSKQFVKCGYLATQHLGGEEKEQIFIPILASLLVIPQPIFKVNVIIPLSHPYKVMSNDIFLQRQNNMLAPIL